MASTTQASPLLALPFELRTKIYQELLNPDPALTWQRSLLRHRPHHPPSQQEIYSEAVSILYDAANVQIHLATLVVKRCTSGNYPDHIDDPPDLFREEAEKDIKPGNRLDSRSVPSTVEGLQIKRRRKSTAQGYVYLHCFQCLRKIHLVTSHRAIWGSHRCGSYFTHTGLIVLRFKLSAEEQLTKSSIKKRLRLTIELDWLNVESQLLMRNGGMDRKTNAVVGLLKALKRRTDVEVEVEEGVVTKTLRELEMAEVEVDKWEKVLLVDADMTSKV